MIYKEEHRALINTVRDFAINEIHPFIEGWEKAVSYTHLTLPTILLV